MKRPKKGLKKLETEVAKESKRQAKKIRKVRLMFQDEARFGRINSPQSCWAPPGVRPSVPCHMVREYTYAYAAVSPSDGVLVYLVLSLWSMPHAMSLFISEVSLRHPNEFIIMVMDKAGWHKAKDLKVPQNMRIIFLPPFSPELNPAEHLWEEIREKWFPNQVFNSLSGVVNVLVDALDSLEQSPEKVASIAGFDWVIDLILKAA